MCKFGMKKKLTHVVVPRRIQYKFHHSNMKKSKNVRRVGVMSRVAKPKKTSKNDEDNEISSRSECLYYQNYSLENVE